MNQFQYSASSNSPGLVLVGNQVIFTTKALLHSLIDLLAIGRHPDEISDDASGTMDRVLLEY
jgi:hypothetical protein